MPRTLDLAFFMATTTTTDTTDYFTPAAHARAGNYYWAWFTIGRCGHLWPDHLKFASSGPAWVLLNWWSIKN